MIRFSQQGTETPEPEEPKNEHSASHQKIFEEIHERLVYDTIE
jgi:hypothetical protein